jgi:hypothetical protein
MALYQLIFMSSGTGVPCRLFDTDVQSVVAQRREIRMIMSSGVSRKECNHGLVNTTLICVARFIFLLRGNVGTDHRELVQVLDVSWYPLDLGWVGAPVS